MTETRTILVALAIVALQWLGQETLIGATLEIDTNLRLLKK
jgi:hypothetical protein